MVLIAAEFPDDSRHDLFESLRGELLRHGGNLTKGQQVTLELMSQRLPIDAIAKFFGLSRKNAKQKIARALKKLAGL